MVKAVEAQNLMVEKSRWVIWRWENRRWEKLSMGVVVVQVNRA